MRRALALLFLLAVAVPALPAVPAGCRMACAKTAACCCAKRGADAGEARLTLVPHPCCPRNGVSVAAASALPPIAGSPVVLPSLDLPVSGWATALPRSASHTPGESRAPPSSAAS